MFGLLAMPARRTYRREPNCDRKAKACEWWASILSIVDRPCLRWLRWTQYRWIIDERPSMCASLLVRGFYIFVDELAGPYEPNDDITIDVDYLPWNTMIFTRFFFLFMHKIFLAIVAGYSRDSRNPIFRLMFTSPDSHGFLVNQYFPWSSRSLREPISSLIVTSLSHTEVSLDLHGFWSWPVYRVAVLRLIFTSSDLSRSKILRDVRHAPIFRDLRESVGRSSMPEPFSYCRVSHWNYRNSSSIVYNSTFYLSAPRAISIDEFVRLASVW